MIEYFCPDCGSKLILEHARYGSNFNEEYLGCPCCAYSVYKTAGVWRHGKQPIEKQRGDPHG